MGFGPWGAPRSMGNIPITFTGQRSREAIQYGRERGWIAHPRGSRGVILEKLTNEDVRKAVELFWSTFLAKSEDQLNSYYAPGSTIFQISMGRSEPGRLGAMRRSREYFKADTRMELKLGPIDVVLIGPDAGVASYTFQFQATGRDVGGGKRVAEKLDLVRATHVFQRDSQGKFRIVHEHFSVPPA